MAELEEKIGVFLEKAKNFFGLRVWASKLIEKYPQLNSWLIIASFLMDLAIVFSVYYGINAALNGFKCPITCGTGGFNLNITPSNYTYPLLVN